MPTVTRDRCSVSKCRRKVIGVFGLLIEGNRWHITHYCRRHIPVISTLVKEVAKSVKLG